MKKSLDRLLIYASIAVLVATILGFMGRIYWVFDLFSHFRVQYFQIALVLVGIALWRRQNRRAIAFVLLIVINYALVLPLYFGKPTPATREPARAMLMNLYAGNGNTEQVLKAIRKADPDLLLLEEVTPKWAAELAVLDVAYPYRIAEPQNDCFGIMLLSKVPLEHGKIVKIGTAGVPSIIADVYLPQGTISIIGTHPLPPAGAEYSKHRDNQLKELPKYVRTQQHPVLLIGDLNTSSWSPHFHDLIKESGLKNSMKGFGFQPTWPSNNRFLRIPLDHALHSLEIIIHNRIVLGDVGSDHFPLIMDFSVSERGN